MSHTKKSIKHSIDHRTTKTKASATKPSLFGISLTRNKNQHNPVLFNSVKKKKSETLDQIPSHWQNKSETKKTSPVNYRPSLFEELNTRVSIDYINSLHTNLLVQFGHQIQSQLQDKQNHISARNLSIHLPSKPQRQCLSQVKQLIQLKQKVNQNYQSMQNTCTLFSYLANQSTQPNLPINIKQTHDIKNIHNAISNFLTIFQAQQKQLRKLSQQYQDLANSPVQQEEISQQQLDQDYLDSLIQSLKQEIAHEKKLCLRYDKEEKFLLNKLYFTQKKNNDLKASSTNLKIKNVNLRDTLRLRPSNSIDKNQSAPKLHRSFSVKLQRIKRYNFESESIKMNETGQKQNKMTRSVSACSLDYLKKSPLLQNIKKEKFINQIE